MKKSMVPEVEEKLLCMGILVTHPLLLFYFRRKRGIAWQREWRNWTKHLNITFSTLMRAASIADVSLRSLKIPPARERSMRFDPQKMPFWWTTLQNPCSVSDWLSWLARENSKPSNIQSETLHNNNNNNIKQFICNKKNTNLQSKTLEIPEVVNRAEDRLIFCTSKFGDAFRTLLAVIFNLCLVRGWSFYFLFCFLLAQSTIEVPIVVVVLLSRVMTLEERGTKPEKVKTRFKKSVYKPIGLSDRF